MLQVEWNRLFIARLAVHLSWILSATVDRAADTPEVANARVGVVYLTRARFCAKDGGECQGESPMARASA
uniref:Putative secreted protein n=1 Tax=Anopheles marajoara TaxID=58244 RepID=A0A2M4CEG1_9DIPT